MYWYPQALFTAEQVCCRHLWFRETRCLLPQRSVLCKTNFDVRLYIIHILQSAKQTRNANSFKMAAGFCPELSYRPDWKPKRCPIFGNSCTYIVYIDYIWNCTYIQSCACTIYNSKHRQTNKQKVLSLYICVYIYTCIGRKKENKKKGDKRCGKQTALSYFGKCCQDFHGHAQTIVARRIFH